MSRLLSGWPGPAAPWLAAAALALAVHVLVAVAFDVPGAFDKYPRAAAHHLSGELPPERLLDLSPLYFELNVMAVRLAPARPELLVHGLQIFLVALAAGFLYQLLSRRHGRAVAGLGWLAFVLDRHVLVYERILEPEACLLFLVVGCLYLLDRGGPPLAAGVFAAASLLVRPTFLPLFVLVPLYLKLNGGNWLRKAGLFGAPIAAALLLLALRAAAVTGDPRTPVMNPGTVFYEGNNALSHGTSAVYPPVVRELIGPADERPDVAHEHYRTVARAATGENLSMAGVNAYWSRLAIELIRSEPGRYLRLLREKLLHAFHGYRWHDVALAWRYDRALRLPSVPFALLAALALLGLAFEAREWSSSMLFYALAALQLAVMLVFYVSARQRLVWLPALLFFAAAGLERTLGRGRRSIPLVVGVLLLAIVLSSPNDLMRDDRYVKAGSVEAQTRLQALREAAQQEPLAAHADLALDALRHAPWVEWVPAYFPQEERSLDERLADLLAADARGSGPVAVGADFDRAVVFLRAGRPDAAAAIFTRLAADDREVYRGAQQPSLPRFYLARMAALEGDGEQALRLLEETLARSPGNPFVLAELWALTGDPRYQDRLLRLQGAIDARYLVGRALLFHGRAPEAAAALAFVVERLPEFRTARLYLAAALGAAGRVDEGVAHYLEAGRRQPDPLLLSPWISELFQRWAELHPDMPQSRLLAAHVLHEHGRFRQALVLLEGIEARPDLRDAVEEEARRLRQALRAVEDSRRK